MRFFFNAMSTLYTTAADLLHGILEDRKGLKTLLYSSTAIKQGQHGKIYALVSQTVLCKVYVIWYYRPLTIVCQIGLRLSCFYSGLS